MRLVALLWFRRKSVDALLWRFIDRFRGRTIIVHAGLPAAWLEEMFKLPGGAGYFRFDARIAPGAVPTPIEWLVHEHVMTLHLPLPLLLQVRDDAIHMRHLTERGRVKHPSEIAWMLDEIETRHHARLAVSGNTLCAQHGLPVEDNAVETPYGFSL